MKDHARGVPGVLAARIHACATGAAGAVEAHGYDLFLATTSATTDGSNGDADGEAGR